MKPSLLIRNIFFVLILGTLFSACTNKKEDVQLRMTHTENKLIEKIYSTRLDSLRPLWDSLCDLNHDKMLEIALDSIVKQRLEEENLLRNRAIE